MRLPRAPVATAALFRCAVFCRVPPPFGPAAARQLAPPAARGAAVMSGRPPAAQPPPELDPGAEPAVTSSDDGLPLTPYWRARLEELTRPSALGLVSSLSPKNALMYENKAGNKDGTLVAFAVAEKAKHTERVLLIRCGDFYEAYGLDALLLVEHAGLNPMGRKARAGCPVGNLQPTLDCLTAAGLTVAVYEELEPARMGGGGGKGPVRPRTA
eukprot:scaffold4951_cov106-Isochrysis_galbana.AAC.1